MCEFLFNTYFVDLNNEESENDELPDQDSEVEGNLSDTDTEHKLPFKVLGSAHNISYQRHLENTFTVFKDPNKKHLISVMISGESTSSDDLDAIAVLIKYDTSGFHRVGYIPEELTKFLHPLIRTKNNN